MMHSALTAFHPLVAEWFHQRFGAPTDPQIKGWAEILQKRDTLIAAPTGSGKTFAAFLACIDTLIREGLEGNLRHETSVLYVSPLKALSNDIQKNLNEPLQEIQALALKNNISLPEIRAAVRTGDTPAYERSAMIKKPPHILITTPESFYLLLTSESGRKMLSTVRTVIVDEIHAMARDKRGTHLAISLERLNRLPKERPNRIGLSATQRPIEEIARFLVGTQHAQKSECAIIDTGHKRAMDVAIEIPREEFSAVASKELWEDIYDRVADLVREHRSTIVFVNTRRLVERATHALANRLGEDAISAHHGSLSKEIRLKAEERLKTGMSKAVVATASLELGIDVGAVDLVCHIGSPRSLAVGLQRIGRAGHAPSGEARPLLLPKGRIFPTTRDELLECASFVYGIHQGHLEKTHIPKHPLDILAQQMVAIVASENEIHENDLFTMICGAWPYASLPKDEFEKVLVMLSEGIATARGARGAWLHRDTTTGLLRPRRGARLAAITSGGAIPDNFTYAVIKEPEGITVGSLEEDFAVESLSGDIFLLGNNSWRIKRVEQGRVRVEDAHGQPPTIPFWLGEAPGRSAELSQDVSEVREKIETLLDLPEGVLQAERFLREDCGLPPSGATQAVHYLNQSRIALGKLPTQNRLIAERFFDEGGGMQLVIHAPFGARLNRAFGLSLRKKFCAGFNFELQAAATDDGVLLSLGPQHSFPLESVFDFVSSKNARYTLEQAVLDSPLFGVRWRWNVSRSLALLRQVGGKRVAPAIQRMKSDDLLAAAFPDQAACQENVARPIKIPDHPLVMETIRNCLYEAMDLEGLQNLLKRIESGSIELMARDTPTPSPLTHEILNSNPYTYLDDAPLEERRARAVATRRTLSEDDLKAFGALDEASIHSVSQEIWPDIRTADELADLMRELVVFPQITFPQEWEKWAQELIEGKRLYVSLQDSHFISSERKALAEQAFQGDEEAAATLLRGWILIQGPGSLAQWADRIGLDENLLQKAFLRLEAQGVALRGRFGSTAVQHHIEEWCDRDVLARIHRRCLSHLRKETEAVTTAEFTNYLMHWQHAAPGTQLQGPQGVLHVIEQLQGLQIPVAAWEKDIFPSRIRDYDPFFLDQLCLNGAVVWGRLLPGKVENSDEEGSSKRRSTPNRNTNISLMLREDLSWLLSAIHPQDAHPSLGEAAAYILDILRKQGAMFFNELQAVTGRLRTDLDQALWELVAGGFITCDGFSGLRNLVNPEKRRQKARLLSRYASSRPLFLGPGGRWSLLRPQVEIPSEHNSLGEPFEIEAMAKQYLKRWGIVFRDILLREPGCPPWRSLLNVYRRLEARGEIRGGRFVQSVAGEQFGLAEAVETLRSVKRRKEDLKVTLSAADPLNISGNLTSSTRVPSTLSRHVTFSNGVVGS